MHGKGNGYAGGYSINTVGVAQVVGHDNRIHVKIHAQRSERAHGLILRAVHLFDGCCGIWFEILDDAAATDGTSGTGISPHAVALPECRSVNFGCREHTFGKIFGRCIAQAHGKIHIEIRAVEFVRLGIGVAFNGIPRFADYLF